MTRNFDHNKDKSCYHLPVAYNGVVVSLNPRNTPCVASERRTAGAPSDLRDKYL